MPCEENVELLSALLMSMSQLCFGSWSVTGHTDTGLMWQGSTCAVRQQSWTIWKRLSSDRKWHGRSNPGCQILGLLHVYYVPLSLQCFDNVGWATGMAASL